MTNPENMDFASIMAQAQQMQEQMLEAQKSQASQTLVGQAGGGQVKVQVDGNGEYQSVSIAPEAIDPSDPAMLEDLVLAAVRDASTQVNDLQVQALSDIGLPELTDEE